MSETWPIVPLTSASAGSKLLTVLGQPIRDRTSERRAATRREILDAAWAVAREVGLAQITLREVAHRVGMQPPSLYSHFESKNAIYDAMFADAWTECRREFATLRRQRTARAAMKLYARSFFDFAVRDLARHQLMNQRTIPGFGPTPESYAPAVATLEDLREALGAHGITRQEDLDLFVALVLGLIDTQLANEPGGSRWRRLLDRTIDMFADTLGK